MQKITLIGGIAENIEIYGGEVIKNKSLLNFLKNKIGNSRLVVVDTFEWGKNYLLVALKILVVLLNPKRKKIILSCFTTGAYYFLQVYRFTSYLLKKDIYYFIVGGSLPDYIKNKKVRLVYYRNILMFAESNQIRDRLIACGMKNISVISNWKYYNYLPKFNLKDFTTKKSLRALSYSRICPEKGIDIIFSVIDRINIDSIKIEVDFFGEVQANYKDTFYSKLEGKSYYSYKGKIDMTNESNYNILSGYDIMLFPTYYFGEGIPGSIIDCFIAGVPVLASDWNFNKDIVEHMKTGLVYEAKSVDALYNAVTYAIENKPIIGEMRNNCLEKAKDFKIDFLLGDFIKCLRTN
jgi:glycosyltransferase involved in cell wall biosynthesis